MNQLHLKYKMDNGIPAYRKIYASCDDEDENSNPTILPDDESELYVPSEEYLEWIEELALKQLKSKKDDSELPALKIKLQSIERDFNNLQYLIDSLEDADLDRAGVMEIKEACDELQLNF